MQTELTGMILKVTPVGDFDRRIVILTKEIGKIAAFARGARRSNSALTAASQPFTYGKFKLYAGRDAYRLDGIEVAEYFDAVKRDMDGIAYGTYFCELIDYLTRENIDSREYLKLLYMTLKALEKKLVPPALVRRIFELRALAIDGEEIQVYSCVRCGNNSDSFVLRANEGGLVCTDHCLRDYDLNEVLHPDTVYTLRFIVGSELSKLYSFNVKPEIFREIDAVTSEFFSEYVDHNFQSVAFLDAMSCISDD